MVLHRLADDVGDLDELAPIHLLHAVQQAALYGLQSIIYMGYGTLEDDVGGVVEEPRLVHSRQAAELGA